MKVFTDTSAFYALASATDEFHQQARIIYEKLLHDEETEFLTSSYVLVESFALIHHRLGFDVLREFVTSIEGIFDVIWVDEKLHRRAWQLLQRKPKVSFVDCTSFLIIRKERAYVFAFDEDFPREKLPMLTL